MHGWFKVWLVAILLMSALGIGIGYAELKSGSEYHKAHAGLYCRITAEGGTDFTDCIAQTPSR